MKEFLGNCLRVLLWIPSWPILWLIGKFYWWRFKITGKHPL